MSTRLTTEEIIRAVDSGEAPQPWLDLFEDVGYATGDPNLGLKLKAAARFLERRFPGRTWGWQDFDKLLADHVFVRWTPGDAETEPVQYEPLEGGNGNLVIRGVATIKDVLR